MSERGKEKKAEKERLKALKKQQKHAQKQMDHAVTLLTVVIVAAAFVKELLMRRSPGDPDTKGKETSA